MSKASVLEAIIEQGARQGLLDERARLRRRAVSVTRADVCRYTGLSLMASEDDETAWFLMLVIRSQMRRERQLRREGMFWAHRPERLRALRCSYIAEAARRRDALKIAA